MPAPLPPTFIHAHAKLNLTLDVLGKRADGYHALASVMQSIALHDTLALWPAPEGEITFTCDVPELGGAENLVARAARRLQAVTGCARGARIELHKQIPAQGGLGGGSSDGAAALVALNRWWDLGLNQAQLIEMAAELGSDVPFFIVGGTALIEGRGEVVTSLPNLVPLWLVVAKPEVSVPTPGVFRALTPAAWSDGRATRDLVALIRAGTLPALNDAHFFNALEAGVMRDYPAVATTRDLLQQAGAACVRMSGSGPTLYVPCATLAEATRVFQAAQTLGVQCWLTHTIPSETKFE